MRAQKCARPRETSITPAAYKKGTGHDLAPFFVLTLQPSSSGLGMAPASSSSVVRHLHDGSSTPIRAVEPPPSGARSAWAATFRAVRGETELRASPLGPEDQVVQSMPDASPTKWHRAHTTWFFEQFLLLPHRPGYLGFEAGLADPFSSYDAAAGRGHPRARRGMLPRPELGRVAAYRSYVDEAVEQLIACADGASLPEVLRILGIGLDHEQQHQE